MRALGCQRYLIAYPLFLILMTGVFNTCHALDRMQVKYLGNSGVIREDYYLSLLDAALKATEKEYGPFQLVFIQEPLTSERKHELLVAGEKLNVDRLVGFPTNEGPRQGLLRVDVPLLNGFMGYRILLIRAENQPHFSAISSLGELRELPMGFGKGWEGYVYKANGFSVAEVISVELLLKMLAGKRYRFVPLSVIEIEDSYQIEGKPANYLVPEKSLLIYMPLPVYFYVSAKEPLLAERLTKGLEIINASGAMEKIFADHFSERLKRLGLSKRKIIELDHPDDDGSLGITDHQHLSQY